MTEETNPLSECLEKRFVNAIHHHYRDVYNDGLWNKLNFFIFFVWRQAANNKCISVNNGTDWLVSRKADSSGGDAARNKNNNLSTSIMTGGVWSGDEEDEVSLNQT